MSDHMAACTCAHTRPSNPISGHVLLARMCVATFCLWLMSRVDIRWLEMIPRNSPRAAILHLKTWGEKKREKAQCVFKGAAFTSCFALILTLSAPQPPTRLLGVCGWSATPFRISVQSVDKIHCAIWISHVEYNSRLAKVGRNCRIDIDFLICAANACSEGWLWMLTQWRDELREDE